MKKDVRTLGPRPTRSRGKGKLVAVWAVFVVAGLLLMDVFAGAADAVAVLVAGGALVVISPPGPRVRSSFAWFRRQADSRDLLAVAALYPVVVGLFRLAFG